jgi:O-antigen ligase
MSTRIVKPTRYAALFPQDSAGYADRAKVTEHLDDDLPELDEMPIPGAGPVGYETNERGRTDEESGTDDTPADDTPADDTPADDTPADDTVTASEETEEFTTRATFSEKLIASVVFFMPFAVYNLANSTVTTIKWTLITLLIGPGLLALVRLLRAGDRAARWATAYVIVSLGATLASGNIALSMVGPYEWANGWVMTVAIVTVWALGRSLTEPGRKAAMTAVMLSATLMSILAWLGSRFHIWTAHLVFFDRAHSLSGNPVYLSLFLSAALALVIVRAKQNKAYIASAFLVGSALEFAGGRAGLGAGAAVILIVTVVYRHRHILGSIAAAGGFAVAWWLGTGTSAAARLAASGGDLGARWSQWGTVLSAFRSKPLLGWGPGRLDVAAGPFRFVGYGPCRVDEALHDAHNVVLHNLATVGMIGTAMLLGWLVSVIRQTRGPVAIAAVAAGLNLMVEPMWGASIIPIVLLVGAASSAKSLRSADGVRKGNIRQHDRPVLVGLMIAALPAMFFLYGDIVLRKAANTADVQPAQLARKLGVDSPVLEDIMLRSTILGDSKKSLTTARETSWDQQDDGTFVLLGDYEFNFGSMDASRTAYERALTLNPSGLRAMFGLMRIGDRVGDVEAAAKYRELLHLADRRACSPEQLATLRPA